MANLSVLIGDKKRVKPKVEIVKQLIRGKIDYEGPIIDASALEKKARHFYHLFLAFERRYGKWTKGYSQMHTCLRKLARNFEAYEEAGLEINVIDFFDAHKARYGKELRPNHLISKRSLQIYRNYMEQKCATTFSLTPEEQKAYNERTVAEIARLRNESKDEVRKMLRDLDLL